MKQYLTSKKIIAGGCLAAVLAATSSHAAIVNLTAGDGFGTSSFNTAGNWSNGAAPSAGNDYFVDNSILLRTPSAGGDYAFGGSSLTLDGNGGTSDGGIFMPGGNFGFKTGGGGGIITIDNFVLNGGTIRHIQGAPDVFTLAGNVHVAADSLIWAKQGPINITATISGSGTVTNPTSDGTGRFLSISAADNTFTGNIVNNGRFELAAGGALPFVIGASGVNNSVSGNGAEATYNGVFLFDLSGASSNPGDSWTVAAAANQTFGGTFAVDGFNNNGDGTWSSGNYLFDQSTGTLEVIPEPSTYALLFGVLVLAVAGVRRRMRNV